MLAEYKKLLENKNFILLWSSQIFSQLTLNLINFLFLIKLFEDTGSSVATSLLWVSYSIPAIFVGPVAASFSDIIDRRKLLISTNLLQSLVIFLFALYHQQSAYLLYGVALSYSFLNQFYIPAEIASLPSIVRKENLAAANGLFFVTQQVAIIFGFGVAGIFLRYIGFFNSLIMGAALLFLAFLSVWFLPQLRVAPLLERSLEKIIIRFFERIYTGYKFIRENRVILGPFLLLLFMQIAIYILAINTPVLATQIFGVDANLAGVFIITPAGVGTAVGSMILPRFLKRGIRKFRVVKSSLMAATLALFLLFSLSIFTSGLVLLIAGTLSILFWVCQPYRFLFQPKLFYRRKRRAAYAAECSATTGFW
jgi:MFS family permease